jgi:UTP-glucose-1-phosphate uridylyltransferase/galactokinase
MLTLFVSGRLCIFGEHSDWAGLHRIINAKIVPGAAIVTGIEQGIHAAVERADRFIMHNEAAELRDIWVDFDSPMQLKELREVAVSGSYFSYVAGVALYIKEHYNVGGMKITITSMTLPMKTGLSSSAAICVLVARAFNLLYELNLNTMGEMNIAFKGEQRTPSRCGRLDQACAFGIRPVCMRFDGEDIAVERLLVKTPLYWVFANLNAEKNTIKILSDLNKCYPFAESEIERNVHIALGERNQEIISKAIEYMRNGNVSALGSLMTEAQEVFDAFVAPASPEQLGAPKLHAFLNDETIKSFSYGGKGVGSQGDGSIQFLAKDAVSQANLCDYLTQKGLTSYMLTLSPQHLIRKAVIPIAGYGTRMYPATRRMKKEMIPLVDKDGLLKPAILILLEQLCEAGGIEEICLVVGSEEDIKVYQDYFQTPLAADHLAKLPETIRNYEQSIQNIGSRISYRIQRERLGFGHAVYQCRDFCSGEAVLLLLGDTIYLSDSNKNCTQQLIEFYENLEKPLVAIHPIPLEQVNQYGILSGNWLDSGHTKMEITHFVEKPDPCYAEQNLAVSGVEHQRQYYAVFGQYILPPEIFDVLHREINRKMNHLSEIDMTAALASFIGKGLIGVVLNGTMYDIGNPSAYRVAIGAVK